MKIPEKIYSHIIADFSDKLSHEERVELTDWINQNNDNKAEYKSIVRRLYSIQASEKWTEINQERARIRMANQLKPKTNLFIRISYVAAVITLFIGIFFIWKEVSEVKVEKIIISDNLIQRGTTKAILQLSSGEEIRLGGEKNRVHKDKEGGVIKEGSEGKIDYRKYSDTAHIEKIRYNNLSVPVGGEYQLVLSDGTKVWLNSKSSLKYPVKFIGKERRIFLNGEAYFEVAHNKEKPFIVETNDINLRVLGTSFNVSAYTSEDKVVTTLVNGSVQLAYRDVSKKTILKPSYQSVYSKENKKVEIAKVDTYAYTSWKEGRIVFRDNTLDEILLRLGRWYDFEVVYVDKELREMKFFVNVNRYKRIGEVLEKLEKTRGVEFEIKGKIVIVKASK